MTVRIRKFRPSDALRPFVRFYYTVESADTSPFPIQNHPQGGVDLVLAFHGDTLFRSDAHILPPSSGEGPALAAGSLGGELSGLRVRESATHASAYPGPAEGGMSRLSGLFILPLQEHPFQTTFLSAVDHVAVSLHPEGAHRLLRVDIGASINSGRALDRSDDGELHELFLRLRALARPSAPCAEERPETVTRLDRFFCRRLETWDAHSPRFHYATKEIRRSRGRIAIPDLADTVAASPRSLQRWSRTAFGLTPKRYAMIVRFHSTVRLLRRCPPERWLDAALGLGYYDQSHFIAEFKRFSGQSPAQFFATEQRVSEFYSGRRVDLELTRPAIRR
ncbi:MAG: helix-turn-helix domain-containing protein [Candidatus Eisenbacteria bacterium]